MDGYKTANGYMSDDSSIFTSQQHLEEVAERIARTVSNKILEDMKQDGMKRDAMNSERKDKIKLPPLMAVRGGSEKSTSSGDVAGIVAIAPCLTDFVVVTTMNG